LPINREPKKMYPSYKKKEEKKYKKVNQVLTYLGVDLEQGPVAHVQGSHELEEGDLQGKLKGEMMATW